jgi:GTPase SAR1 family protein
MLPGLVHRSHTPYRSIPKQDFRKPFDAPAVVVVGHQSSGKSALIEALMGFQFNQVGGGTKTRRPVALRMQYNPRCSQPKCFLVGEDGVERHMTLSDIQDYIEKENKRLERDPLRSFDSREINVRMEYKYCPNMILIDTPGLIAAPKVPKGKAGAGSAFQQQRALQASAREAERLVVDKMGCQDYIILCVEDTSDWKHGATREIVQKADPDLSRTVIVNTKFDTKIPQFGTPSDVLDFLRAKILDRICPHKLGGPFYTSVPSGRVGRGHGDHTEFIFDTDEDFVEACAEVEQSDRALVTQRLKRVGKAGEAANSMANKRVGLRSLRTFLEERVDESYRRNVAKIIPMLQSEYVAAERRLKACEEELAAISVDRLKAGADVFCDQFCVCLKKALQGSIVAPASLFGETLAQETSIAGSFCGKIYEGTVICFLKIFSHENLVTKFKFRCSRVSRGSF